MRIGSLKHKIVIQTPQHIQNSVGEPSVVWEKFSEVFAEIKPILGKEYMANSGLNAEITHQITIRYLPGLTPLKRILFGDRIFNIESVINIYENNRVMQLMVKENV